MHRFLERRPAIKPIVRWRSQPISRAKIQSVILRSKCFAIFLGLLIFSSTYSSQARAADKTKADERAGAVLFRDKGCAHCHGDTLEGSKKGPSLKDINQDASWTPAKMNEQILNGGQKMPPFSDSLTDDEIAQLIAYLRAKVRPVAPPVIQEK